MSELPAIQEQRVTPSMAILLNQKTKDALKTLDPSCDPEALTARARMLLVEKPALQRCTPESLLLCVKKVAASGLDLNGRDCHIVPRGNEATFQIDWKGYVKLAKNAGLSTITPFIVHERDSFTLNADGRSGAAFNFTACPMGDRGKPVGALVVARNGQGDIDFEWMTREEILAVKARSPAKCSGPWVTDELEMWKKTVIRRMSKRWQLSKEAVQAFSDDDDKLDLGAPVVRTSRIILDDPEPPKQIEQTAETQPDEKGEFNWK